MFLELVHPSLKLKELMKFLHNLMKHNEILCFVCLGHLDKIFQTQFPLCSRTLVSALSLPYYPSTASCSKRILQLLVSGSPPRKELKSLSTLFYSLFEHLTVFQHCLQAAVTQLSSCRTPLQLLNILAPCPQLLSSDLF